LVDILSWFAARSMPQFAYVVVGAGRGLDGQWHSLNKTSHSLSEISEI
jgi:hypothetical protein